MTITERFAEKGTKWSCGRAAQRRSSRCKCLPAQSFAAQLLELEITALPSSESSQAAARTHACAGPNLLWRFWMLKSPFVSLATHDLPRPPCRSARLLLGISLMPNFLAKLLLQGWRGRKMAGALQGSSRMIEGCCHCGAVRWSFAGTPDSATACNCTVCRRYGALWAYDYENERIGVSGPTRVYAWGSRTIGFHFCADCGCVAYWRALAPRDDGRHRIAVICGSRISLWWVLSSWITSTDLSVFMTSIATVAAL
jgi:hypothetical protein